MSIKKSPQGFRKGICKMDNTLNQSLFSVVLYTSNEDYHLTLESLLAQEEFDLHHIFLILMKGEFSPAEEVLAPCFQQFGSVYVSEKTYDTEQTAYQAAGKHIRGQYFLLAECGSVFSPLTFAGVSNEFELSGGALSVITLRSASTHQNASEIREALKGKYGVADLNERYTIPLMFLSNCFFSTRLTLKTDYPILQREPYESAVLMGLFEQTQAFRVMRSRAITVSPYAGGRYVFEFFEDFRGNEEAVRNFFTRFVDDTLQHYRKTMGFIPKYVQNNILSFLKWTFTAPSAENIFGPVFTVEDYKAYLQNLLTDIDDTVINNSDLQLMHKYLLYSLKYHGVERTVLTPNNKKLFFENTKLCDMNNNLMTIEFVTLTHNQLILQGRTKFIGCTREDFSVYALVNGEDKVFAEDIHHQYDSRIWEETIYGGFSFTLTFDLSRYSDVMIELYSLHQGDAVKRINIRFGKFSPLASNVSEGYYYADHRMMTFNANSGTISVVPASGFSHFRKELRYLRYLRRAHNDYASHAYLARILYHITKPFYRKPIWLVSDRINKGDDNGEALFKYLQTVNNKKIKVYFVIDRNCEEGKRMAKIGKTISTGSKKHKMHHLRAAYVISSQGNNPVVNPLLGGNIYYRDILCKMRFVFLQHGVTKDDISSWLNLYNRNMFGFVVTTNQEYQSVFDYDYFYTPEHVWLTGMPRNDLLYHDEKKYITIMPTWRKSLMVKPDPVTGIWQIKEDFKESRYFNFYNSLLNSERLIKAAKEYGYTVCYKPHPNIEPYMDLFDHNDEVYYFEPTKTYREIFAETDLLLTDYSSVAFDFAYLRKPIVYAQFDKEAFFSGEHSYTQGYFDYERDGFGEVTYDLESTIDALIDGMKHHCQPKEEYLKRINNTFAFSDKNCCQRVYEKLLEASK